MHIIALFEEYAVYNQIRTVNANRFIALKEGNNVVECMIDKDITGQRRSRFLTCFLFWKKESAIKLLFFDAVVILYLMAK